MDGWMDGWMDRRFIWHQRLFVINTLLFIYLFVWKFWLKFFNPFPRYCKNVLKMSVTGRQLEFCQKTYWLFYAQILLVNQSVGLPDCTSNQFITISRFSTWCMLVHGSGLELWPWLLKISYFLIMNSTPVPNFMQIRLMHVEKSQPA